MRANSIYIAGPMRGLPEKNFPAFNAAAQRFREMGWTVFNPVEIGDAVHGSAADDTVPGGEYLRADLAAITVCGAIAVLPGWERSTGARAEIAAAITIGLCFYDAQTLDRIEPPARVTICGGYEKQAGAVEHELATSLNLLSAMCHKANEKWWIDITDGVTRLKRNKGELLALIHSEISECLEGERKDLMDDKLPHRKMAEVELADALIRIFDYAAGFGYDLSGAFAEKMAFNAQRDDHKHEARKIAGGKQF